jgi:hypothetical protein
MKAGRDAVLRLEVYFVDTCGGLFLRSELAAIGYRNALKQAEVLSPFKYEAV